MITAHNSSFIEQSLPVSAGQSTSWHTVHATLSLTCTPVCWSSFNQKSGLQIVWI